MVNTQLAGGANDALLELENDDNIYVVLIKGAGQSFCAGVDVSVFLNKTVLEERLQLIYQPFKTITGMSKPVIAAVRGTVAAMGLTIVAACDLAIAADDALFGTTAINVGLFCLTVQPSLYRSVGKKRALRLLLTGDLIDAREAERIGLINEVIPGGKLDDEAMKLAEKLASKAPVALQTGKRAFYTMWDMKYDKAIKYLGDTMAFLATTEDATEGITAFLEKRKPQYKGK
ncbi:2,3-dehydroadipyl-CoA hydratase [subsurface metagenome]